MQQDSDRLGAGRDPAQRPSFEEIDWRLRGLDTTNWGGLLSKSARQKKTMDVLEVGKLLTGIFNAGCFLSK